MERNINSNEKFDALVRFYIIQAMINNGQLDLETGLEMQRVSASEKIIEKENKAKAGGGASPTDSLVTLHWKLPRNPR